MVTADRTQMLTPVQAAAGAYEPMYDTERPRRRRGAGFWALSVVGIVAAIIGALLIGRFVFGGSSATQVQVPNLDGLTIEQATTALQDYDLRIGAQTPEISDRPIDTIIAQQPAAGESIEQGQSVNVTVSSGLEQVTVPQLIALTSVEAARIALQDASLVLGAIKEKNSPQPAGYVLAQDPEEGTQVDAASAVDITVSSGLVKVPKVVGTSEAQARSDLAQAGFDVQVVEIEDGSVSGGTVLAQSPQGGELLPRGSVVTITVSTSPPPPPTPTSEPTPTQEPVPSDQPPASPTPATSEFAPAG
jgi:eukaryotic-like serine/threonine-protein kinase